MVFGVMEGCMEEQLRGQASANAAAGDHIIAMFWNGQLSSILSKQGRNGEAVVFQEANLKHLPRVVPENHPNIGAT